METQGRRSSSHVSGGSDISPQTRSEMVAVAAYYRAERRSFQPGNSLADWIEAEAEIDRQLGLDRRTGQVLDTQDTFQRWLEPQLRELDEKLAALRAQAPQTKAKIRSGFEKQLQTLAEKLDAAKEKLQELRPRSKDAWGDLKAGAAKILTEMQATLDQIASRFK